MANIAAALGSGSFDILAATPATLTALLGNTADATVAAPNEEGWTVRDVLAHMIAMERPAVRERVAAMLEHDNPAVQDVNETEALEASGLRDASLSDLLARFAAEREESITFLRTLSTAQLQRPGRHGAVGPIVAAHVFHHFAYHDMLHLRQIAAMLGNAPGEARGNMAKLG